MHLINCCPFTYFLLEELKTQDHEHHRLPNIVFVTDTVQMHLTTIVKPPKEKMAVKRSKSPYLKKY